MASIQLENVVKVYANGQVAARGINLDVRAGELVVLVGPSGSGKSTILRIVAGLEKPTHGRVFLDEKDVTELPPQKRDLAMVFQNYALYPHKSVRGNLEFGLRMKRVRSGAIAQRVDKVARKLGLEQLLDRSPGQLSGGERQRVALGRAIVREPKAFLLDEPLSNLDALLRVQTRGELARLHRQLGATMLYVTHDQEEALTLGDRVAVLRDGDLQQVASPMEIYRRPANVSVAGFIGSPSMNFFRCALWGEAGRLRLVSPWFIVEMDGGPKIHANREHVLLGVRPDDVQLIVVEPGTAQADAVGRVDVIQPLGSEILTQMCLTGKPTRAIGVPPVPPGGLGLRDQTSEQTTGEMRVTMMLPAETKLRVDDRVGIRFPRDRLHLFEADSGRRLN
jgi:multiple sugar transport system ATP-binding protein